MPFRVKGLDRSQFEPLFVLGDAELEARGMRRLIADAKPGFPCRVSLEDATPGERVLLLGYEHQPAWSPFRTSGPIFVRETARKAFAAVDELPPMFARRLLSLRAYDAAGMMVDADVVEGRRRRRRMRCGKRDRAAVRARRHRISPRSLRKARMFRLPDRKGIKLTVQRIYFGAVLGDLVS